MTTQLHVELRVEVPVEVPVELHVEISTFALHIVYKPTAKSIIRPGTAVQNSGSLHTVCPAHRSRERARGSRGVREAVTLLLGQPAAPTAVAGAPRGSLRSAEPGAKRPVSCLVPRAANPLPTWLQRFVVVVICQDADFKYLP